MLIPPGRVGDWHEALDAMIDLKLKGGRGSSPRAQQRVRNRQHASGFDGHVGPAFDGHVGPAVQAGPGLAFGALPT